MHKFLRCKYFILKYISEIEDNINIFLEEKQDQYELISIEKIEKISYMNSDQTESILILLFYWTSEEPESIRELHKRARNNLKILKDEEFKPI